MLWKINLKKWEISMKKTVFIVLCCCAFETNAYSMVSEEDFSKLAVAVWKTSPESLDISYTLTTYDLGKDEDQLRIEYKKTGLEMYQDKITPEKLDEFVELNVRKYLESQQEGQKKHIRVRYDKYRQRIDTDTHYSSKTFIEILDNSGKISRFEYDHKTKEALIKTVISRDKYSELSDVPQFWTTPAGMAELVKRAVGDRQKDGFWEPNEIKAGIFCSRGLDNHCFEIKACPESPGKKIVEDKILSKKTQKPLIKTRLVVDSNDYSKVYEYHIENMNTGTEMMAEIRSNFDSHGFPHKVISKEYDKQGKLRLHLIYEFDNVQINPSFGVDTFEIESKGYTVIDQRKG